MSDTLRPRLSPKPLSSVLDRAALRIEGDGSVYVTGITHNSRQVVEGDIYAALPGFTTHGAQFAPAAVAAGARAILTDEMSVDGLVELGVPLLISDDPRRAAGLVAAWVYGDPADDMVTIGITGTNGKTTTAALVEAGLREAGHVTGLIGTIGTRIGKSVVHTERTTPEATEVHALLAVMRERGISAVVMEVSSHAMVLHRVSGLIFDLVGFTNLTRDHLDFHETMDAYFAAKALLFTPAHARRGVVCINDSWGQRLSDSATIPVTTLATEGSLADWQVGAVGHEGSRSTIELREPTGVIAHVDTYLPGRFNVVNVALAYALLNAAGVPSDVAIAGLAGARGVPGRMERVGQSEVDVVVDYAHTPDAVDRVISTTREFTPGRVIVVIGAGGDRDREKRELMGLAASAADVLIVTDDNPRSEDPASIRAAIVRGIPDGHSVQVRDVGERREAIRLAVEIAVAGDCVLILGKGHEVGQEIAGVRHPFDDRVEAASALAERESGGLA